MGDAQNLGAVSFATLDGPPTAIALPVSRITGVGWVSLFLICMVELRHRRSGGDATMAGVWLAVAFPLPIGIVVGLGSTPGSTSSNPHGHEQAERLDQPERRDDPEWL
ncbi:MAG: hypothetical protein ACRDZY_07680 [Acidimicrobiales bacterium]